MATHKLQRADGSFIHYEKIDGAKDLTLIYLHGLNSSLQSYKAEIVKKFAAEKGVSYLSLDYTGHGESSGTKEDFRIGRCLHDTMDVIQEALDDRPVILVGSSLGSWIAFLTAERLPKQVRGVISLASGVDFFKDIWNHYLDDKVRAYLKNGGTLGPNETRGYFFSYPMFQEAEQYYLIDKGIKYDGPVALIQGDADDRVPTDRSIKIKNALTSTDVVVHILKGYGHSLHDGAAQELLIYSMERMLQKGEK